MKDKCQESELAGIFGLGVSKTKDGLGSGVPIVECGLGLTTLTFLGSSMVIFLVLKQNPSQG